jgi:dolichol-phosphate mannosyltransferase
MKLVFIIPTYNERENIITLLDALRHVMKDVSGYSVSYLVVDDNSPDGTQAEVEAYKRKHADVFIITGKKEGLGRALLRGVSHAIDHMGADVILQMDADLSHDPKVVPHFLKAIQKGADFVVGSRYIPEGSIPDNWGIHRKVQSVVGNAIVRFGLGMPYVHDWTGGFRAYKKIHFDRVRNELGKYHGYVFQIAFLHKAILNGAKVAEVPIHFTDRKFGKSKIIPSEYIRNVFLYVFTAQKHSPRVRKWVKFLIVGGWGFIINTIILELLVWSGFHPAAGSAIGAEGAIVSNFLLNNHWTFRDRKIEKSRRFIKFLQFNGTSLGAIALQAGVVYMGTHVYGIEAYRIFYILGVMTSLVWNYVMYSRVIWKKQ